jgi:hypothetical protein
MSAHAAIARAERNGLRLRLLPDGRVRVEADAPPPPDLLAELRRYRNEVAKLLAEQEWRPGQDTAPTAAPSPAEAEAEALARELAAAAETVAEVLRTAPPDEDAEAMVEYYESEPTERPYVPGDTDRLRDGLWASAQGRVLHKERRMRGAAARHVSSVRGKIRGSS